MILRFKTEDSKHYMNINFNHGCYNFGETPDRNYITVSDKGYSDILDELGFNCYAYSEDLRTGDKADRHPFVKGRLNDMCLDCPHLYNICDGTKDKSYSNCVWKTADKESFLKYLEVERGAK